MSGDVAAHGDEQPAASSIRVFAELRSDHVRLYSQLTPAECLFFDVNFDLVGIDVPGDFRRVSLLQAMVRIATSKARVLELPEPLWARFLPRGVCLAMVWTLSGLARGRWRRARTYAKENNAPLTALLGDRALPRVATAILRLLLGGLVCLMYERIGFASEGAAAAYLSLPFVGRIERRVSLELPMRPAEGDETPWTAGSAVFVGQLEPRKGLRILLPAWELVESMRDGAHLHILGSGLLEPDIHRWARERPRSRTFHGHRSRNEVLRLLPAFSVLVAPSIRTGRWREQIGLPITESLSYGLTVVTTDETALAPWLLSHGHHVVEAPPTPEDLAKALLAALDSPLQRAEVIGSLPRRLSRTDSDHWLHL
jgi:glycosyltransferase involved in cell wall biosynthesis